MSTFLPNTRREAFADELSVRVDDLAFTYLDLLWPS